MIWTILILVWFLILTLHSTKKMAYKSFKAGIKYGTDNYDALVGYKGIKHFEYKHCKPPMNPQRDEYLAELMFDIPLQDLSAYQRDKLTELQAHIDIQVYGFHEYIMGKNIIRPETDQAFNYARLHRAIDAYIEGLKAKGDTTK